MDSQLYRQIIKPTIAMRKYVAYTPSENEYIVHTDLSVIKGQIIKGDIVKTYTGVRGRKLALRYTTRNRHTLIVAKLAHLGDNPKEIMDIYNELGPCRLICCDCSVLSPDTIPLLFEHSRMLDTWQAMFIKTVTRLNKKKGCKQGNPKWRECLTLDAQKKGAEANRLKSQNDPANQAALPEILRLRKLGMTGREVADFLNKNGFKTPEGKDWIASSVLRRWNKTKENNPG